MATSLADLYKTQYALATQETSNEKFANSLMEGTKDLPMNSLGSGLAKGLATGYAAGTAKSEGTKKERMTAYLQDKLAYEEGIARQMQQLEMKKVKMEAADAEAKMTGTQLGNALRELEFGSEEGIRNYLAANEKVATLLGDDGEGGIVIDGARMVDRNGAKFVQAYGRDEQGQPWSGRELPYEGILKVYAPETYSARSKQRVDEMALQAEQNKLDMYPLERQKLEAEINAQNALTDKRRGGVQDGFVQKNITDVNGDQVTVQVPMGQPEPMPATITKMQNETIDQIQTMRNINSDLGKFDELMTNNKLDFGFFENKWDAVRNTIGLSNEESRNSASFRSTLEKLRNDSLRLNNGVQTEGDAQRAWDELFSSMNDKNLVQQRLKEIMAINERGANLKAASLDRMRMEYGHAPYDYSGMDYAPVVGQAGQNGNTGDVLSTKQAADIKAAYKAGQITREQAKQQLMAIEGK